MRQRVLALGLVAALCAVPVFAIYPDIPGGDDVWDTPSGGGTSAVLLSADWFALCGVSVPDTAVQFKGFNLPNQGTGDTLITRLQTASLPTIGSSATVGIRLKDLSFVEAGTHPCSSQGLTLRVREDVAQATGSMTITRTSNDGGTFSASVPVSVIVEAVDGAGNVVGSTFMNGVLNDSGSTPWSYQPPNGGAPRTGPWYPGVDPATHEPATTCRFGNENAPSTHCYKPAPKCGKGVRLDTAATAVGTNPVLIEKCEAVAEDIQPVGD